MRYSDMFITIAFLFYMTAMVISAIELIGLDRRIELGGPIMREDLLTLR